MLPQTILLVLSILIAAPPAAANEQCGIKLQNAQTELPTLTDKVSSLNALSGNDADGKTRLPLKVLFQVDLGDEAKVGERRKALEAEIKLPSSEAKALTDCANSDSAKKMVAQYLALQRQVDQLKVSILALPHDERIVLAANYAANRLRESDETMTDLKIEKSLSAIERTKMELQKTETESGSTNDPGAEQILVARSEIEKFQLDIESEYLDFINKSKLVRDRLNLLRDDLSKLSTSSDNLQKRLEEATRLWEAAADELLSQFASTWQNSTTDLPDAAEFSTTVGAVLSEEQKAYLEKFSAAKARQLEIFAEKSAALNEIKAQNFKILQDAGALRAFLIEKCSAISTCDMPKFFSSGNLKNIGREVKVMPIRIFAGSITKWVEIRRKFQSGIEGWADIGTQLLVLFVLILIPFFITRILNWITQLLEAQRQQLFSKSIVDYRQRTKFSIWIARVIPFVNPVGMILSFQFARMLLATTDLREFELVLFYAQVFFVYRVFSIVLKIGLEAAFSSGSIESLQDKKDRISASANRISRLVFIQYTALHIIEDAVRKALVYNLAVTISFWVSVIILILEIRKWKTQIFESFAFRHAWAWDRIKHLASMRLGAVLAPAMLLVIICYDVYVFVAQHLLRIDLVKRLISEVIRRRLEKVERPAAANRKPASDYLTQFNYYLPAEDAAFVNAQIKVTAEIIQKAEAWQKGLSSDDVTILVGNRGMGKTTTLKYALSQVSGESLKVFARVPARVHTTEAFYAWLSKTVGLEIRSIEDFRKADRSKDRRTLYFVDDIQNLFLGAIGGFDAYRLFIEIVSLPTKNSFWCFSVNSRSWAYLGGVFGPEHCYGSIHKLRPWNEVEIQKLILARHGISK